MAKPDARARHFWKRLVDNYGVRLTDQYGTAPPPDWCDVIRRSSDTQLNAAIVNVRRESPVYAPSLGQFEKSIPAANEASPNVIDELAQRAAELNLCKHQRMRPWSYFGKRTEGADGRVVPITEGVVIAACETCDRPSRRLRVEDL